MRLRVLPTQPHTELVLTQNYCGIDITANQDYPENSNLKSIQRTKNWTAIIVKKNSENKYTKPLVSKSMVSVP